MRSQFQNPSYLLVAVAALMMVHYLMEPWFRQRRLRIAPGPFPIWPVLGSLPSIGKLPHRTFYHLSKKYGDVMELKLGSTRAVVISSPDFAKEILKTHDQVCASRPDVVAAHVMLYGKKDIAFAPYGNHWRHMRKLCELELLSAKRLRSTKNLRSEEVSFMVKDVYKLCKEGKGVNMQSRLYETSMNVVTRMLFKRRYFDNTRQSTAEAEEFKELVVKLVNLAGVFNLSDYIPYLKPFDLQGYVPIMKEANSRIDRFLSKIIEEHVEDSKSTSTAADHRDEEEEEEAKDFVDVMLSLPAAETGSGRLEKNTIKAVIADMIGAGTDTSATTVEWALVELLRHPEAMKKAQEELDDVIGSERVVDEGDISELKYLQAIVKETFRLHPPATLLSHESIGDCTVGGYFIPAKTRIFVNVWAVHRHPSAYQKPLEFNPSRFVGSQIDVKGLDFQLLPFGSGRRMCPGLRLGLIMVHLELARLLHSFTWKLPAGQDPQDIDMDEIFGLTAPKAIPLHVVPTARLPLHLYTAPGTTH
ncbi:unnamed protein product [Sphagnum troendelagicum]|uniref:Cytochrome P450 n=1 Tax=Sphagnum troendelagicum TaxID=128251 RepID=A0ABP0TMK4_9BRYO